MTRDNVVMPILFAYYRGRRAFRLGRPSPLSKRQVKDKGWKKLSNEQRAEWLGWMMERAKELRAGWALHGMPEDDAPPPRAA